MVMLFFSMSYSIRHSASFAMSIVLDKSSPWVKTFSKSGNDTQYPPNSLGSKIAGYEYLAKEYGIKLVDLKNAPARTLKHSGIEMQIAEAALDADFLINVPVLKAHCQTKLTCCMKNLKGCIPEKEMRRFHTLGLHKPIAALTALLPVHYCVVDGICGDLSFEEGGSPVQANRIIAGRDSIMMDSYCAGIIGYRPEDIGYLAGQVRTPKPEQVVELSPARNSQQKSARLSERYSSSIDEDGACSVCYAALVYALHRSRSSKKCCIGQGFVGKTGDANIKMLGIGSCTAGFKEHVAGCPPRAVDIIEAL